MRALLLTILFGLVLTACSTSGTFPPDAVSIRANADIGMGRSRLLVGVSTADGTRLGSPDDTVTLEVAMVDDPTRSQSSSGTFSWIVPDVVGMYRAEFDFDRPGIWQVTVIPEDGAPLEPTLFQVLEETFAPNVGEQAPLAPSLTLADGPIEELTTDPEPDPRLYELSLDDALVNGRPTVVVFSTPAFCETAACGPMLNTAKALLPDYPGVDFVHVEVYTGLGEPGFAVDAEHLAPAVTPAYWNLASEPWIFVVDESGIVVGRFEGVMDATELELLLEPTSPAS